MASKDETEIDARFFIPDNIVDIRRSLYDEQDYTGIVDDPDPAGYPEPSLNYEKLPTPMVNINVISQVIKMSPDGTQTIDVILDLPDQIQGTDYEVRTTKVV